MTDKQIIIDGVDVSKCSYHYEHTRVCLVKMDAAGRYYNCANWHDCDFKKLSQQLKCKEQECEELKKEIIDRNEKIEELKFSVSDLTNRLCDINAEKSFRIVDLEQTLADIKEIAERGLNCSQCSCGAKADLDLILQKIDKVEDDLV